MAACLPCMALRLHWYTWHCKCTGYSAAWARTWVCPEHSCTALSRSETMSNPCGCLFILSLSCLRFRATMIIVVQCEEMWHSRCHSGMMLHVFSFPSLLPMLCVPCMIHVVISLPFWVGSCKKIFSSWALASISPNTFWFNKEDGFFCERLGGWHYQRLLMGRE